MRLKKDINKILAIVSIVKIFLWFIYVKYIALQKNTKRL